MGRSHMTRRNALISALAMSVSLALTVPSIASGSQTIGQTGVGATCGDDEVGRKSAARIWKLSAAKLGGFLRDCFAWKAAV